MQSLYDPGQQPLSPSSFFNFDGAMEGQGSASGSDEGVDLFKYYMDLQAYQGKDQQQQQSTTTTGALDGFSSSISTDSLMNTTMLSPYNAFYNPSQYPSSNYSAANPISQQLLPRESDVDPSSNTGATLFPFAEASNNNNSNSSNTAPPSSSYNASINPSSILSFDHLAGSENPQPIDPHLLMTGLTETSAATTTATTASSLPTVKEEEDIDPSSTFPLNNAAAAFPLSMSTRPLAATTSHTQQQRRSVSASATTNKKRRSTSAATTAAHDDSMNGIDGLSDEDPSDSEGEDEDDDEAVQAPRKRSSAAASAANKKRTSAAATSKASMNNKRVSSAAAIQSKKESSVGHHPTQQLSHPHALVPVPEWEDKLSKAEYDKLSSKEKRQMRNKISARNFRHRRKAHIDTLEALVADKDQVIAVLNEEVSTLRTENQGLRADIEMLKKNWESIAAKIGASAAPSSTASAPAPAHHLTPDEDDLYGAPGSLPALSPAASSSAESTNGDHLSELSFEQARGLANSHAQIQASQARPRTSSSSSNGRRTTRSSTIQRPNLRKDLGPSGTSFSAFGMGGNRSMNVHTTLIPELNFNFPVPPPSFSSPPTSTNSSTLPALSDASSSSNSSSSGRNSPTLPSSFNGASNGSIADMLAGKRERDANANTRLNMNPALNGLTQEQINNLREQFFNANNGMIARPTSPSSSPGNSDDATANVSGKISRHGGMNGLDPLQNSFFDTNPFISLRQDSLQDYRAQLYAKLANNVAGIHQAQHQSQSQSQQQGGGMNGLRPAFFAQQPITTTNQKESANVEEVAKIASIAQKTLFDKLSTAFWDAFAGNNTSCATRSIIPSDSSSSSSPSSSTSTRKSTQVKRTSSIDGQQQQQQVVDLLAGRSSLRIVRNDEFSNNNKLEVEEDKMDSLAKQVEKMGLKK